MFSIDGSELWRIIPPEEKIAIMNRAHARGALAAIATCLIGGTVAAALFTVSIMWISFILAPLVFQFAAGKAWRDLRPRVMLEYLAARSASRRYAFSNGSRDLTLSIMMRGRISEVYNRKSDSLENPESSPEIEIWIALFKDILVVIAEKAGGANCLLGQILNDRLTVESSDNGGYTNDKAIVITVRGKNQSIPPRKFKITSDFPAALAVLEKRLLIFKNEIKKAQDGWGKIPTAEKDVALTFGDE